MGLYRLTDQWLNQLVDRSAKRRSRVVTARTRPVREESHVIVRPVRSVPATAAVPAAASVRAAPRSHQRDGHRLLGPRHPVDLRRRGDPGPCLRLHGQEADPGTGRERGGDGHRRDRAGLDRHRGTCPHHRPHHRRREQRHQQLLMPFA